LHATTKTKKETQTKNFRFKFAPTEESYVKLLKAILVKHHIKCLPDVVGMKKIYPMKIQVPPAMYVLKAIHDCYSSQFDSPGTQMLKMLSTSKNPKPLQKGSKKTVTSPVLFKQGVMV
jgi:hypothetical protein